MIGRAILYKSGAPTSGDKSKRRLAARTEKHHLYHETTNDVDVNRSPSTWAHRWALTLEAEVRDIAQLLLRCVGPGGWLPLRTREWEQNCVALQFGLTGSGITSTPRNNLPWARRCTPKAQVAPAGFLLALEPAILPLPFPTLFASSVTSLLLFQFLEQVKNSRTCEPQDLVCANSLRSDRPESGPQFADMDDDRTHPPPIIADLPIRDSSNRISPLRNLTASRLRTFVWFYLGPLNQS